MARIAPDWDLPDLRSETIFQALVGVLEAAGPSIVITDSATVTVGWMVVRRRPDLVRAHIAVEGGGGPIDALTPSGGSAATFDAAMNAEPREFARVPSLTVLGDYLDLDELWSVFGLARRASPVRCATAAESRTFWTCRPWAYAGTRTFRWSIAIVPWSGGWSWTGSPRPGL